MLRKLINWFFPRGYMHEMVIYTKSGPPVKKSVWSDEEITGITINKVTKE